jgi:hypothetical protein
MNNHQKQVRDNTSLVGFIGSRPHFPESATGFGVTGYGKIGFGEPRWAHATTRPVIPDCASKVERNSQPIRSLRNVKPLVSEPVKAQPQAITVAQLEIAKSIEGNVQRTMDICDFINAKLGLCRLRPTVKKRLAAVEPLPANAKPLRGNRFEEVWLRELSNE